ncbi:hypothetical protein M9458_054591 [Cirrhinus mrigala]|uniref:Uncharacterized protein n=1 Tax=Cirrhinus mrigala TaxID=683832 RepID=A0ABD0MJ21_CIRMR
MGIADDLADELKKGLSLAHSSVTDESELLEDDAISLTALLAPSQEEQEMFDEDEDVETESPHSSCPAYEELLEVMERTTARLDLPWKRSRKMAPRGRLDERSLSDHSPPAQVSLPFLHLEIENYANIEEMCEKGYEKMPAIEEMLASYLSIGETSSLKAPFLPSRPLQATSHLNGKAYTAAECAATRVEGAKKARPEGGCPDKTVKPRKIYSPPSVGVNIYPHLPFPNSPT